MNGFIGPQRVLILDDEESFGKVAARAIEQLGVPVLAVSSKREFVEAYDQAKPSILVLDIVLGHGDVCDVLDFLGARQCKAPLILISGYDYRMRDFVATLARNRGLHVIDALDKRNCTPRLIHHVQRHLVTPVVSRA